MTEKQAVNRSIKRARPSGQAWDDRQEPVKPKNTKRASTYPLTGGGFLHIDRILVPIFVPWMAKKKPKKKSKS